MKDSIKSIAACLLVGFLVLTSSSLMAVEKPRELTQDDVLSVRDGRLYLEGKPFAEISFNKEDLFWQIYNTAKAGKPLDDTNAVIRAQDQALANVHSMGLKTVRIFGVPWANWDLAEVYADPVKKETVFYAAVNKTLDLCDKHDIRVDFSLNAHQFYDRRLVGRKWEYGEEHMQDLLRNPESKNRKRLYAFLDEFIPRMKGRKAIAMWEIGNEATLAAAIGDPKRNNLWGKVRMPTLTDVSGFYRDIRARLKTLDPLRIVNNGGSNMTSNQWNNHLKDNKKMDTFEEQFKAFELLFSGSGIEVMDIHSYPDNRPGGGYPIMGENGQPEIINLFGYQKIAARLKMPLMVGELGVRPYPKIPKYAKKWADTPDYFESMKDVEAARKWHQRALDEVVNAGVPLVYWWTYDSAWPGAGGVRTKDDDFLIKMISDANSRLKRKLGCP